MAKNVGRVEPEYPKPPKELEIVKIANKAGARDCFGVRNRPKPKHHKTGGDYWKAR